MKKVLVGFIPGKKNNRQRHYSIVIRTINGQEYPLELPGSLANNLKSGFLRGLDGAKPEEEKSRKSRS